MHGVETYERIRQAYFVEGWKIRKIAREFGVHRRVVRKAIEDAQPEPYRRDPPTSLSPLAAHTDWIDEILRHDLTVPKKQRHTAKRIFDRLVAEHNYRGGESSVRRHVARRKKEIGIGRPEVYVPLDHPPGRDAQVDWGEALVKIQGQLWNAQVLCIWAGYSGAPFVCAFAHQKQEALFEGMRRAFEYFGGVFHKLTFDNMPTAVKKILQGRGRNRLEQDTFIAFRSHYLFKSFYCLPGKKGSHEKGGVEGRVGFHRRNWLVPIMDFPSWEALNEHLLSECRRDLERTADEKTESIGTLLEREKPLLLPLPAHAFDCCRPIFVQADSHSRIRVDGIRYSVPTPYAYRDLLAKVTVDEIIVIFADQVIARHRRRFTSGEQELNPVHYIPVLATKPHLLDFGLPFVGWRLPAVFHELRGKLEEKGPGGLKEYVRVLQAIPQCDVHTVACAIDETLRGDGVSAQAVLGRLALRGITPVAPRPAVRPALCVGAPDVRQYDQLLRKETPHGNESFAADLSEETPPADDGAGV
jgi:transposase